MGVAVYVGRFYPYVWGVFLLSLEFVGCFLGIFLVLLLSSWNFLLVRGLLLAWGSWYSLVLMPVPGAAVSGCLFRCGLLLFWGCLLLFVLAV